MVLHERHGHQVLTVDERLKGELLPKKPFLQHDVAPEFPDVLNRPCSIDVLAHDPHTLPAGESDRFDGEVPVVGLDEPPCFFQVMTDPVFRASRDPVLFHQSPAERLIRLKPCGRTGRPHRRYPRRLEVIDDARLKRRLRPDDRSVKRVLCGELYYLRDIGLFLEKHPLREPGDPRVFACHNRKYSHAAVAG